MTGSHLPRLYWFCLSNRTCKLAALSYSPELQLQLQL